MTHFSDDSRWTAPDDDWEERAREEEAEREARDDERLHAIYDRGGRLNDERG